MHSTPTGTHLATPSRMSLSTSQGRSHAASFRIVLMPTPCGYCPPVVGAWTGDRCVVSLRRLCAVSFKRRSPVYPNRGYGGYNNSRPAQAADSLPLALPQAQFVVYATPGYDSAGFQPVPYASKGALPSLPRSLPLRQEHGGVRRAPLRGLDGTDN